MRLLYLRVLLNALVLRIKCFLIWPKYCHLAFSHTMAPLPPLRSISLTRPIQPPRKIIKDDADVETWKHTTGYKDYSLFVSRLNNAVIERDIPSVELEERSIVSVT